LDKINKLNVESVEIQTYSGIGKFILIKLPKYNLKIVDLYEKYQIYKNNNAEKINEIYQYLEGKIPEEFIGYSLFRESF
jgi:hypothetical protein